MKIIDFDVYRDLLKEKSGLCLSPDKGYLLESRLGPLAKEHGFENLSAMTVALQGVPNAALVNDIVEAMTTNETSFFRDMRPFDIFKDTVMAHMKTARAGQRKLRIWCAAAASGQEPYTLAILLNEMKPQMPGWDVQIVATDISRDVLELARAGTYSQFEVQRGMPITLLMKYFTQVEDKWKINDEIKSYIKYDYFNLLDPMSRLGRFDIIFCRNVLIYFDQETKGMVLNNMSNLIEKDGYMFLGGAETVIGITDQFVAAPDKRGLYVLPDGPHIEKKDATSSQALA